MKEYHKIETLFERDNNGTKKLIEGKFRNESVEFLKDNNWIFTEKIDGCLISKTKLLQTNGEYISIGEIVNNKLPVEIYGYKDGRIVPTRVIGWHYNGITENWLKIKVFRRYNGNKGNSFQTIQCTPNHKFYVGGKYVRADELKVGDKVLYIHDDMTLSFLQEQILTGLLLGDGNYSKCQRCIEFSHTEDKEEYIDWILKSLGRVGGNKQKVRISGYGSRILPARTISCFEIEKFTSLFFKDDKKYIPKELLLSPISLAVIYMDDGSLQKNKNCKERGTIAFNDYDEESVDNFLKALKTQLNIEGVKFYSKGWNVRINTRDFEKMQMLISPYICQCMKYKISEKYQNTPNITPYMNENLYVPVEQEILEIEKINKLQKKYDITTSTHNYFANGILVHNCNIRIHWDGHKVEYGGRTDRAQIPSNLVKKLNELFCGIEVEELFEQKFGDSDVILYGEGYGAGIQKGGAYRDDVSFILFDVEINGVWLKRESVEDIARCFGIEIVPVIFVGQLQKGIDFVKGKPKSTIGTADMEGLVARPEVEMLDRMGRRIIVKIKVKDFE